MVGVGRDNAPESGSGAELYAVIGNAPRLLDRNVTLVGRVLQGIDRLASLPRGTGNLGFYENAAERTQIREIRFASEVPPGERTALEALRTDSDTFRRLVEMRRFRRDDWYREPAGHVDVCNVPLPVRPAK
jgi:peptidylprolyl isomerase